MTPPMQSRKSWRWVASSSRSEHEQVVVLAVVGLVRLRGQAHPLTGLRAGHGVVGVVGRAEAVGHLRRPRHVVGQTEVGGERRGAGRRARAQGRVGRAAVVQLPGRGPAPQQAGDPPLGPVTEEAVAGGDRVAEGADPQGGRGAGGRRLGTGPGWAGNHHRQQAEHRHQGQRLRRSRQASPGGRGTWSGHGGESTHGPDQGRSRHPHDGRSDRADSSAPDGPRSGFR
jgi:hypothetical protein